MASNAGRRLTRPCRGRVALVGALLCALALAGCASPSGARVAAACSDTALESGATARVCLPSGTWAGDVLVYVPGFSPARGFRNLELPGGTSLPDVVTAQGLAFATTDVGLVPDTRELIGALPSLAERAPRHIYLAGASQGGLVVTLLAEQEPSRFAGTLALCGPIGDYARQVDHFGDFRVLFDYFFPGLLPGEPTEIPPELAAGWAGTYTPLVRAAVEAEPARAAELVAAGGTPVDARTPQLLETTTVSTTLDVLWYNVFATNGAREQFGGNPYDNTGRVYAGSSDDAALNASVGRFGADPQARAALSVNETSGRMLVPLVVLHTTGDPVVPYWHVEEYLRKARDAGREASVTPLTVERYGHCTFEASEVLEGFLILQQRAEARLRVFVPLVVR
jgi:pimeloyl-ACP methyl ester carboxylesterase